MEEKLSLDTSLYMHHWILSALLCSQLLACQATNANHQANFNPPRSAVTTSFAAAGTRDLMGLMQRYHAPLLQRDPALIQLKYQAMTESPFVFYRATAFLFYNDLKNEAALNAGVTVPLQGDFHLENMGTYRTAMGNFAYDLNDFDEAVSGPHSWDLARMAVSIHLAAAELGLNVQARQALIAHFFQRYLAHLQQIQAQPALLNQPLDERFLSEKPAKQVQQARERFDRAAWLAEMTRAGRFAYGDKLLPLAPDALQTVKSALTTYAQTRREGPAFFGLKDAASRIAGKGSLGRYRFVALIEGPSPSDKDDLILEIKEAAPPSAVYAGVPSNGDNGQRIVQAYRYFLPQSDPYVGSTQIGKLPAYVREFLPDESVNLKKIKQASEYEAFLDSVALIIARAHARSGQVSALLQKTPALLPELGQFADRYYEQVLSDYQTFRNKGS